MSETLDRLAELAGIQPAFRDYFGNETVVSDATKVALLRAMGYDVASEECVAAALRDIEDESWLQVLAPVSIVRAGAAVETTCTLPASDKARRLAWTITLEDGSTRTGELAWTGTEAIEEREVGGRRYRRRRVRIAVSLPLGYHRLTVARRRAKVSAALIVVPEACFVAPAMERDRVWALATQLYALRSSRNWGIGDFSDLAQLAIAAGRAGAWAVALNPLHELYPNNPWAASPYAPSSRSFLNPLYVDVCSAPDFAESAQAQALLTTPEFAGTLASLRDAELVDYAGVAAAKRAAFELLFRTFSANHLERPGDRRAAEFRSFVRTGGRDLERLALYEALAEHFSARDGRAYGWLQWPQAYRSPDSAAVTRFARERRDRVDFFLYLQWLADRQLARAHATAQEHGVGLYRDLAVGVDRNGADAWSDRDAVAVGASLGAPADPLNTEGQNWGLPPLSPRALRARSFAPLRALLRANLRHARILRVDHVMALTRAFWIPQGRPAAEGAYVSYPLEEMLGILALESQRGGCVIVGEDLGTVPEGFRERLQAANVLSSRLVYFEREWDGSFRSPYDYSRTAVASIGTHDLPPLLGWWTGSADDERRRARWLFVDALVRYGCIDEAGAYRLREDAQAGGTPAVGQELSVAAHRFLARTPSMLAVVAIEDVLDEVGGVNVPGTIDEHPNWRRKRSLPLEALAYDGRLFGIGAIMSDIQREAR